MDEKKVLVTIPTYNEGLIIKKVISEIKTIFEKVDILVIDAYSTDGTYEQVKKNGANIIQIDKIFGISLAIETGILFAYENDYDLLSDWAEQELWEDHIEEYFEDENEYFED